MKNCTPYWRKWHVQATLLLLLFSFLSFTGSAQLVAKGLTASNGTFIGFYQYTPYDYNPNQSPKYPVIIFLHGIGERGNGTTDLKNVLNNGTPRNINEGHTMRFFWNGKWETFLVLIPQLSNNYGWWQDFYVDEMIKYAKANLNIDPDRITLTGLSLGGGGTWSWSSASANNAKTLNCIGVCCGTCPNTGLFPNLVNANLPIWAFHASNDGMVGAGCTTGAISALNNLNPAVKPYMTIWPDGDHFIWGRVYDTEYNWQNPNIYEWFLGQNRTFPVNKRPNANAGAPQTITTGLGTVTLDASGSTDEDGTIVRYIWTKLSGPNYGSIATSVSTNGKATVTGLISAGTYEYQVKVVDNRAEWTFATVKITVNPGAGPNQAPTANAGADITINQPASTATLNGTGSFDPEAKMASYTWTKVSGPTGGSITNANAATATATGLTLGTYVFRLEVKDQEGLSGSDEVKVTVNGPNMPAVVAAGADIVIALPTTNTTLDGSASNDPDGPISKYEWTKVTGPPNFTIASPNSATTALTGLVQGTYTFKLTIWDNLWIPVSDIVQVTVNPAATNQPPAVNAGTDITITLPTNNTTLTGSATDPNGNNTISTYKWTRTGGPTQFTLANSDAASTGLSNLVAGTYTFTLTVTDNGGLSGTATVKVIVNAPPNQKPVANAGSDLTITLPANSVTLDASGSSDADGFINGYAWSRISGPTQFTLANAAAASTGLSNLVEGTYAFKLVVTDNGGLTANDTILVTVKPAPVNQAPVAKAGTDINITLPTNNTTLDASASTDPDGSIVGYSWAWIAGPAQYTLGNSGAASTSLSNLVAGTYAFQLTVTDNGGQTGKDTIRITVNPAPAVNQPPVANAGTDISLNLPTNNTTLNGSASSDADGNINGWSWAKIDGPAAFTLSATNVASPSLSGLVLGTYKFELTVTDDDGATDKDTVTVTVNPEPPSNNQRAVAVAGVDVTLTLPNNSTTLDGSASYDPDGTISAYQWFQITGPSQYTIANDRAATTVLSNLVEGTYQFKLRVWDGAWVPSDDTIKIIVNPEPNRAPVANAGTDITITLPVNNTTLNGSASTDPNGDNTIASYAWARISGPTQFTLANANAASTALSNLVQGTYVFELTVTDNGGLSHTDQVQVVVNPIPNRAPVANAGSDITITLPANSTTLNGTASADPEGNGTIASYSWVKLTGPTQYNIANAGAASTALNNLVEGTYTFELTITDNGGLSDKDTVSVRVNPIPNRAPVANAGADVNIPLPNNSTTLDGTASTDPDGNNTIVSYAWTLVNGPAQYTLANANAATTALSNLVQGTYTFQLTVTDNGGLTATDQVVIVVSPIPNRAPNADAGADKIIALPTNSVTLDGTGSTDPEGNNTIVSYNWTKVSGPAQFTLSNPNSATTTLSNLAEGTYTFELTVTDNGGLSDGDIVLITVSPNPNRAPVANAGADITLTLPNNSTTLDGSASSDPDGNSTITYSWSKTDGPGQFNIANAFAASTALSNLAEGVYTFVLTVTDNYNVIDRDTVKVTVIAPPNVLPIANAGADISANLPDPVIQLDGSASTDPDGTIVSYAWTKVGGPGALTIINSTSARPTIVGVEAGVYEFELTVTDNRGGTAKARVKVTVVAKGNNKPVANAGKDIQIAVPATTATLNGQLSYDADGPLASYVWKQVKGPAAATIGGNTMITTASNLQPGDYVFELTVTDANGATAADSVTVSVVNNLRYNDEITVYPNPSRGSSQITIRCITDTLGAATLTIMDQFGRPVEVHRRLKTQSYQEFPLRISHLRNGNYYIEVQIERKKRMVVKFIKR
jgi:predicted esterase